MKSSLSVKPYLLAVLCLPLLPSCNDNSALDNFIQHTPEDSISITAVGDIMLGGTAEEILIKEGYSYPFRKVRHLLDNSDIVIGNLEGPLTTLCASPLDKEYIFRSPPDKVAPALHNAGFNILNLANNHILDFGVEGMTETIDALTKHNIHSVGVGNDLSAARSGILFETAKGSVGFLSYSLTFPESFWATENKPGAAFGHEEQIREDIQRLKTTTENIVVSFHWGREKNTELRPYQPTLAHAAIDAGASLVVGHHPHVLQAVEQYKHGLIIYSLGNFVFGSYSTDAINSVIANITLHRGQFYSATFTPINVLNTEVVFQPQILKNSQAYEVIQHINRLSAASNTRLMQINQQGFLHTDKNKLQSLTRND